MKKCVDLSARTAIQSVLEIFCEHGVPSHICSDRGCNFVSCKFETFCKDLGISLNFSSGYHHPANQAEHAMCTVKDLMKHCNSVGVHWCIALLEFLCTPGPDGCSLSELLGRQFCGILPMIDTNTVNSDKFAVRKDKEKEKFDDKHPRELKPLLIAAHSPDIRSYLINAESDQVISHNRVHLRPTNVNFALQQPVHQNFPEKVSSTVEKIVSQPVPNTSKSTNLKTVTANKCSTVGSNAGYNNNCYQTRSSC